MAYGYWVETLDELKSELDSLKSTLKDNSDPRESLNSTNIEWFQLSEAHAKLPALVSMMQVVVEHLEQLSRSAERHRLLAHEHQRNGEARMSQRSMLLAQQEERFHTMLLRQLMNSWNDSLIND